jgi:hypothetical protein
VVFVFPRPGGVLECFEQPSFLEPLFCHAI